MQRQHRLAAQFAATPLVGFGGIGEAVAEHDASFRQRGLDHFRDVLGTRGEHQRQLRHRGEAGGRGIEQKAADFLSGRGPTWLARYDYREALCLQYACQFFQLRALAATVESFEGDEAAAMRVRRHSGNHKSAPGIWNHLAFVIWCVGGRPRPPLLTLMLCRSICMLTGASERIMGI